jgi:xanthine dehydrogenase accessory factor
MVVMSFGYRSDDIAVRALLGKRFNYFGILGSKNKIEKMFAEYSAEGLANELKNIHAPVGIPIASQTPEEIAVSIAAEIIRVKNSV